MINIHLFFFNIINFNFWDSFYDLIIKGNRENLKTFVGIDIGSLASKVVLISNEGN